MKYFFSCTPDSELGATCQDAGVNRFLLSYARKEVKNRLEDYTHLEDVVVDSGAYTVWNLGRPKLNVDKYITFCQRFPESWWAINMDIIPETGASKTDLNRCAEEGLANFLHIKEKVPKVIPVYHIGEDIKFFREYMNHTDYIGLSPKTDTIEAVKREFLKKCFNISRDKVKIHGLGYSSKDGLETFPFYSVDSISFVRVSLMEKHMHTTGVFSCLRYKRIRYFLRLESYITELWKRRGIEWS